MEKEIVEIKTMESIYGRNEDLAQKINNELTSRGVFAVNVMGAPGAGKTSSLIEIIKNLKSDVFVIEGDIESDIDTKKLNELGIKTVQINTGGACHLDTPLIENMVNKNPIKDSTLFIENIGNLVCPAEFLIGEHIKMLICTTTEGSDKPYKYPLAFEKADVIIINKADLIPYVNFDLDYFTKGVRALNKNVPIFVVSAMKSEGFKEVATWLTERAAITLKK